MAGLQLVDARERGLRIRRVAEREKVGDRLRIDGPIHRGVLQHGLDLRTEDERGRSLSVMKRFDSDSVSGRKQRSLPPIPYRKCKHPAQTCYTALTVLFVEMDYYFSVAQCSERVSEQDHLRPQLSVVVDLAVEYNPNRSVFVADRLMSGVQVDDRESSHSKRGAPIDVEAFVVRTAMLDHPAHAA